MFQNISTIISNLEVAPGIFVLKFHSPAIAKNVLAGQFVNIRVKVDNTIPLLRRPFSIYHVEKDCVSILYNTRGIGTTILSQSKNNDKIDVIGPLGNFFKIDDSFDTALLIGGGIGVAALPILTDALKKIRKKIITFLGSHSSNQFVKDYLENIRYATDDGSLGYKGTVLDLFNRALNEEKFLKPKIFACGPQAMLKNLATLVDKKSIPCEISVESVMACGVGLCQGCPIELSNDKQKYALVCKDGPIFDSRSVRLVCHD